VSQLQTIRRKFLPTRRLAAFALATGLAVGTSSQVWALKVEDVITLTGLDVPDEQIIKKIQKDGTVFKLTPAEILELKKKGVSDKVIRFMLQTGQGGATAPTGPAKIKGEDKPKRELSAAEQAAEEAKLKEESPRLAEEQRKREDFQRKAFANKVLSKGQEYADNGEFVKAIQVFNKFVEDGVGGIPFAPDSDEAYIANYGIANALVRAGLWQSGASKLLDVVRAGPEKKLFGPAFMQLRELRRKINYRPPELEDLTRFSIVNMPQDFQDAYNYFVGEFLHDFGLSLDAKPFLEKVHAGADDYARSQYLLGLIPITQSPDEKEKLNAEQVTEASQGFQKAVLAAEKQGPAGVPVVDLAYLSLARLAYDIGQFDAAIYYYKKISKNSPKLATAFYESGWTYFLKNDSSRAIGTFEALHSPYFAHHFYPELWILEATMYVNMCQVEHANEAMKMFTDHVMILSPPLRDFIKKNRKPEDYYASFVDSVNRKGVNGLPRVLQSPVMENVEFYNLYQTIKQIEKEEATIKGNLNALGQFGQDLLGRLGQLRQERISEAGVVVQKTLRQVGKDLDQYQDKLDQLKIDLIDAEQNQIDDAIAGKKEEVKGASTQGSIAIAGSDSMVWPFDGEFWKDEIGAYRSFLRNKCAVDKPAGP
jgi:tetratricopeptide (TPR) repeat protein